MKKIQFYIFTYFQITSSKYMLIFWCWELGGISRRRGMELAGSIKPRMAQPGWSNIP